MRKTCDSSRTLEQLGVELAGRGQVVSERLLDHDPGVGAVDVVQPGVSELAHDDREERRGGREVEHAVQRLARLLVELAQGPVELLVDAVLVERPRDVAHVGDEAVEHIGVGLAPGEALDRLPRHLTEVLVRVVRARHRDQLEALGQSALVRQVVERRQQLPVGKVARAAEDDQRGRVDRQPLEPLDQWVVLLSQRAHRPHPFLSLSTKSPDRTLSSTRSVSFGTALPPRERSRPRARP